MSEYDTSNDAFVMGYDLEQAADADDVSRAPSAVPAGVVTGQFFDESGQPRDDPEITTPEVLSAWADGIEREWEEQENTVDARDFPDVWAGMPGVDEFDAQAQNEAGQAVAAEAYRENLIGYVRQIASREFALKDEAAIGRAAAAVEAGRQELFTRWLASGATTAQALQALTALDVEGGIRQALEGEKYLAVTSRTKMAAWRREQEQQAELRAAHGFPPRQLVSQNSPTLERMAKAMFARAERDQQRRDYLGPLDAAMKAKPTTKDLLAEAERLRAELDERAASSKAPSPEQVAKANAAIDEKFARAEAARRPPERHEGDPGDPPKPVVLPQKLVITERDGKVSTFETSTDATYLRVEWSTRDTPTPWIAERVDSRFGLASIESIVLEDVEPEEGA